MSWANYANTGPFVNNAAPGISATFLNNIESFLDQVIAPAAGDSHYTTDGAGNLTTVSVKGVLKSIGGGHTLTDWNFGATTANNGGTTVTHGIKNASGVATTPTVIFCTLDNFAIGEVVQADTAGTTTFRVSTNGATTRTIWWLALLA